MNFTVIVNMIHSLAGQFARKYCMAEEREEMEMAKKNLQTNEQTHRRERTFSWLIWSLHCHNVISSIWHRLLLIQINISSPYSHTTTKHSIILNILIFRKREKKVLYRCLIMRCKLQMRNPHCVLHVTFECESIQHKFSALCACSG